MVRKARVYLVNAVSFMQPNTPDKPQKGRRMPADVVITRLVV